MLRRLTSDRLAPVALVACALLAPLPALGQDSDGDGVNDAADAAPCDAAVAAVAYAPGQDAHGMLQFEDEWPNVSDLDFNDVVLTYNYVVRFDASGRATSLTATFDVLALGGTLTHGLAMQLPAPQAEVARVTRTLAGETVATPLNNVHAADPALTVDIVSNLRNLFGGQAGQINSIEALAKASAPAIQVDVVFATPVPLDMREAPFDVFIFRVDDPGHQIHRPRYRGTATMNTALFGTGVDASSVHRAFVDHTGLPYVLHLPELAPYPKEATSVSSLFPDVAAFAASGGASNTDFYTSTVVASAGFGNPDVPTFVSAPSQPDLSCLPVGAPCADLMLRGSTTSGVYLVDPDGAGGLTAFEVYCEMGIDGGGWTLISNRRANTTNTEACGGNVRGFFTHGCGTPHNIAAGDSYALDAAHRAAVIANANEILIIQYLNGVADTDDAYIMRLTSPGQDLFPNIADVRDTQLGSVCTLDRTRCDSSSVFFKYSGDSWYHSSVCSAYNWAGSYSYRGNYGLCHDAWTGASSSYFTGDRVGYAETKLWAHPNGAAAYQERIFYR